MSHLIEKETVKQNVKPPKMYAVIIHNDDFTTFEFVIECLMSVFNKSEAEASKIAMSVHQEGKAIIGTYTLEIAETKQTIALKFAEMEEHPLKIELSEV